MVVKKTDEISQCESKTHVFILFQKPLEKMESAGPQLQANNEENLLEVKGNGNLKRKHGVDASSDDENDFLGFDLGKCSGSCRAVDFVTQW